MWYPEKAGFRAGQLEGSCCTDYWNASNIGIHSVALGRNTEASGEQSVAMGEFTTASGNDATAMGRSTEASGEQSVAMGKFTTAGGFAATAMGNNVDAKADWSLSIGQCNVANNTSSTSETLLVAGNGSVGSFGSCLSNSDAMVLDQDGNLEIAGSLTESSDRRLTTSIEPLGKGVLTALQQIRPVRFRFKDESTRPSGKQIGLIAQDVQKEFPALVSKGSGGYLSLAYPKMTALLLKGLQEQQSTIERQKAQIDSLRSKAQQIENLQKRLSKLEAARSSGGSVLAGLSGIGLVLALLAGGLLGAGLARRRS
jgi:autotransporter adhesin